MKLYFAPRTRAMRARWLLEELEVPYEGVRVDPARPDPALPLGEVPLLVDGGVTLSESAAICLYLADRFPEKGLAPAIGSPQRAPYLQWLLFAEVTLEPVVLALHRSAQLPSTDDDGQPELRARLTRLLTLIEHQLGAQDCLAEVFTAADVVMASILHLANSLRLLDGHPALVAYVQRHTGRAATRRAVAG